MYIFIEVSDYYCLPFWHARLTCASANCNSFITIDRNGDCPACDNHDSAHWFPLTVNRYRNRVV